MTNKDDSEIGEFILSPLHSKSNNDNDKTTVVEEDMITLFEGGIVALTFFVMALGFSLIGLNASIVAVVSFFFLTFINTAFGVTTSLNDVDVPYEWQAYGERNRVIRKIIDLEEEEQECFECGEEVGIGVERHARDEMVLGGFVLKETSKNKTYNCACCSTYLDEDEYRTTSIEEETETETEEENDEQIDEVISDEVEETDDGLWNVLDQKVKEKSHKNDQEEQNQEEQEKTIYQVNRNKTFREITSQQKKEIEEQNDTHDSEENVELELQTA